MMNDNWQQLTTLLTDSLQVYRAILELSRQKRDILVAANAKELEIITGKEEALILQAGKLEGLRQNVLQELSSALMVSVADLTLMQLIDLADPATSQQLAKLQAEFAKLTGELAPINDLNARLLQQALTYINYNVNILTQNAMGPTYGATPQQAGTDAATRRALFDKKI
jgi:flagellar biosynthesis/type III secretory pathway chaperone